MFRNRKSRCSLRFAGSAHDGDDIYGDYTVARGNVTQVADYEPGVARSFTPGTASGTVYYHQDMLGSSRLVTTSSQSQQDKQWYTAFGESGESTVSQRYGYAGAWGYETDNSADGFPFLHVGARYYDPATGRFLQRDPIGVSGGLNAYNYVHAGPTFAVDPDGEIIIWVITALIVLAIVDIAEAPSPVDTREDFRNHRRRAEVANIVRVTRVATISGGLAAACAKGLGRCIQRCRLPNPPPYNPVNWPNTAASRPLKVSSMGW